LKSVVIPTRRSSELAVDESGWLAAMSLQIDRVA